MALTKASLIDVNGQELILDADADTSLTADTDDQIDIKVGGSDTVHMGLTTYNASDRIVLTNTSGNASMTIVGGTSGESSVFMADGTSGDASYRGYVQYQHTNDNMNFGTAGAERMRMDSSGRLLIGLTATQNAASFSGRDNDVLQVKGGEGINSKATTNGGGCFVALGDSGNTAGSYFVSVNSSGSVDFRVAVGGALSKASGSFKIEHPLESKKDTHNLVHSFIEGPQADLIYRGVAVLENGTASINLDTVAGMTEGTFVLLNTNTSCFTSNESDWDAVKGSVSGNTLTISCQNTSSTATVSWLVIGERHDQHMKDTDWTNADGKVIVEPLK